ncbi:MAG: sigma-54 dependent transcriptional regulator [Nitrospiraceae bacterium]|nr:sigma-54 dependent transcriptional regulator [Nitrospiraceae bacterium]
MYQQYPAAPVMLVDDEPQILLSFSVMLRTAGINNLVTANDSRRVTALLSEKEASLILLDLSMPHLSGIRLLSEINSSFPNIPVIIVTATDNIEIAVDCMKSGAFDYLVKPIEADRLLSSIRKALDMSALQEEVSSLKHYLLTDQLKHESAFASLITQSRKMRALFQYAEAISRSLQPVLITGETGVGKELMARAIHDLSGRKGEFVPVNISGLDDPMFSDTLFGHKKGAYTGAEAARDGLIAQASGGTLFLDEIGDLSEVSQVKLLRLLQENSYLPLGSDVQKKIDARAIVATNRDIVELMKQGKFRKDLYYRLRTHQIHIPPLRERKEDIPLLLNHFLDEAARSLNKKKPTYPRELVTLLSVHPFAGNVRELQAMVYDAVAMHTSGILSMDSFKAIVRQDIATHQLVPPAPIAGIDLLRDIFGKFPTLREAEDYFVAEALRMADNNQGIASSLLGITRQALNKRLNRSRE